MKTFDFKAPERYPICKYVVANPATWNPAATSAAELLGCSSVTANDRVLCPSGQYAGFWKASSATVFTRVAVVTMKGWTVLCTDAPNAPTYLQTADDRSSLPVFEILSQQDPSVVLWFPPIGDAGAELTALSAAEAARPSGPRTILQQPGTYTYTTPARLANGTDWLTHEQAANVNAIATHVDPQDAIVCTNDSYETLVAVRTSEILLGSIKFTVSPNANELHVGDKLYFQDGQQRYCPAIVSRIIGAEVYVQDPFENTYGLTLDENEQMTAPIVRSVNTPKNITIRGKGLFTGSGGARLIEMAGASNCLVRDIRLDDSQGWPSGGFGLSFDNGGYRNVLENVTLSRQNHDSVVQYGLGFESQFHSVMSVCRSYGLHSSIALNDCIGVDVVDCTGIGRPSGYSMVLQSGGNTPNVGCINTRIIRGTYGGGLDTAAPVCGIKLDKCTHAILESVTFLSASDAQLSISSAIPGTDIELNNPQFKSAANCAILATGTGKLRIRGGATEPVYYTSGVGISWGANMTGYIDGLRLLGTTVQPLVVNAPITVTNTEIQGRIPITAQHTTGKLVVDKSKLDCSAHADGSGVYSRGGATSRVVLRDMEIKLKDADTSTEAVNLTEATAGAITELWGVKTTGGSTATGVKGKAGCPVLVGTGNDLSSCATQYDAAAVSASTHVVTAVGVA